MKKIKLITGLSTLAIGGSVAVTATSCTTYPPYMSETFTITTSNVNFGGLTTIKSGDTLPYELKDNDHLTLTLKGVVGNVDIEWSIVGGVTPLVRDVDYSINPVINENDQTVEFTVLTAASFEPDTVYTIKASVQKDECIFSFKTKGESTLDPKIKITKNNNARVAGGTVVSSPIALGSFQLYGKDGKLVETDETSNLSAAFDGDNQTGFTNSNLSITYASDTHTYTLSIKDGSASENVCIGYVATTWNTSGKVITAPTNLTITVTEKLVDPTINVVPDYNEQIIGGTEVKSPITLGVFQLFGSDEKIIKTDESNNLDVVFTGTNNTGFTNANLQTSFNASNYSYTVAIKDGTANRVGAVGNVSIIWHIGQETVSAPTNLIATVLNEAITTPNKTVFGTDCATEYTEDQTIPVIQNSGVYLELTDPDTSAKINAKWIILSGEIYAQLVDTGYTPLNGLMFKTSLPQTAVTTLVVKAIPEDSTKYADVVFTVNVQPDTTTPVITATQGDTTPVLQYENTQVVVNDTISFALQNATVTQWEVIAASGGSEGDEAQVTDVSFADPTNGTLTVNKTFYDPAVYTIQATYGNNATITYNLELTGGAVITATITAGGSTQDVIKFRQLSSDLAVGNVLTFTIDDKYKGEVDHWTASYEAYKSGDIPGFTSPASGQKVATWTVIQEDIDNIPASSYLYVKAYGKGNSEPLATFTFQAKVHNLTTIKNGTTIVFPYTSPQVAKGSNLDYTDGSLTGNIDGSATATTGGKWALIEQSQSGDYTASIVDKGGGKKALRIVLLIGGTGVVVVVPFVITVVNTNGITVYGTTWITFNNITG